MTIEQCYHNNSNSNDDDDGYDGYESWIEGNWRWILPLPHNNSNNNNNNNNKTQAIQASEKNPDDDTVDTAAAAAESNTKSGHQQRGRPPAKRSNQTSNTFELLSNDDGGDSKKDDDDEDTTTTSTNGIIEWVQCEDTDSNIEWVQCDKCGKWRKLPSDNSTNELLLDDDDNHWDCSMMKTWKNKQSVAVSSSSITAAAVVSYCDTDEDAMDAQHHEVGVSGWKLRQTHTGKYWYRQQEEQQKQKEDILSSPYDSDTSPRNANINIIVSKKNGGKQQKRQPQQRSNRSTGNIGSISKEKATHRATTGDTDTDTDLLMKKAIRDAHDYMLSKYGQAYVDKHNNKGEVVVMV